MSVYTPLDAAQLASVLEAYGFRLVSFQAASHGIENSTFLIDACDNDNRPCGLVLTIFESLQAPALSPYLGLLNQLARHDLPVPAPLKSIQGDDIITLVGKPAVLMPRLPGHHDFAVDEHRCRQIGTQLALLHAVPTGSLLPLPGERQRLNTLAETLPQLPAAVLPRAQRLLEQWQQVPLGKALIHADLFRDNVLWDDGEISALLDFYNACLDCPEYDLAVTLNDWCVDSQGCPQPGREKALLAAYTQAGGNYDEQRLRLALAVAALRFWLSRLAGPVSEHSEGQGSKDPEEFARIYAHRVAPLAL